MYTQCPKCDAAFRITAEVLQQARGQVRCGSCETAFNALDHLSEEPPSPNAPADGGKRDEALLQTLNKLAGPDDIRIEDTGVEWLVVDDDDAQVETDKSKDLDASGSIKWILEGTGDDGDIPVAGDADPATPDDDLETAETAEQAILDEHALAPDDSEARYDDNTPLPDDFEAQHDYVPPARTPLRRSTDPDPADAKIADAFEEAQTELELSEPDDWMDLLDEFSGAAGGKSSDGVPPAAAKSSAGNRPEELPLDVEEELAAIHDELSSLPDRSGDPSIDAALQIEDDDLNITLSPDSATSDDAEAAPPAAETGPDADVSMVASQLDDLLEAMGSGKFKSPDVAASADVEGADDAPVDEAPDDDISLKLEIVADQDEAIEPVEPDVADGEPAGESAEPSDAVESGSEQTDTESGDPPPGDDESDAAVVYEETTGEFERAIADAEGEILAALADSDETGEDADAEEIGARHSDDSAAAEHDKTERDEDDDDSATIGKRKGTGDDDSPTDLEDAAADDLDDDLEDDLAAMTGSMQIDAKLLRAMKAGELDSSMTDEDGVPIIETIVMEGDFVRGALHGDDDDGDFMTGENKPPPDLPDPGSLIDTYISNRGDSKGRGLFAGKRAIAGAIILLLLLVAQFLHYSRDSLATFGLFNQTLGPVYRLFGEPVTPNWDIKGWQFEATSGSTDETDSLLTVSSRIANRSQQPLPYPLVHISLTDRYEEIVGSKVLEPNDYLAGGADPSRPVAAGDSFTAVISIASPADEATGFKLNVCYRVAPGRVRCAIEDFKAP